MNDLDKKANDKGATDPYEFAKFFKNAGLETPTWMRFAGSQSCLTPTLSVRMRKLKQSFVHTGSRLKLRCMLGRRFLLLLPNLTQLEATRSAMLVHHMVTLQMALGPDKTAQVDAYLKRAIVPHISLKPLLHPVDPSAVPAQPSAIQ